MTESGKVLRNPNPLKPQKSGAPGETRTPDLLIRSQSLYPAELRALPNNVRSLIIVSSMLQRAYLPRALKPRMPVETEIKLRLSDGPARVIEILKQHGYTAGPRELEIDQIYDHEQNQLRASGRLLRIRQLPGAAILTYKGPAIAGRHKSREELEVELSDKETFIQILTGLG